MSIKKRLLSAALALALGASLLTGCSKGADGSGSQSSSGDSSSDVQAMDLTDVTDPYLATAGIAGDTVVGTVGDYEVTADSLLYWLNYNINYTKQQYSAYGISDMRWDETSEDGTTTAQALLKTAMQLASFYRLLPELAGERGPERVSGDHRRPEGRRGQHHPAAGQRDAEGPLFLDADADPRPVSEDVSGR